MLQLVILAIFGSSLFSGTPTRISPYEPIPEGYVLKPGDSVSVEIYGSSQLHYAQNLDMRGAITIPNYGPIGMKGMTLSEANKLIYKNLKSRYAGSNIELNMVRPSNIHVTVKGEVTHPGEYLVHGYSDPLMVLNEAGGVTSVGSLRAVQVYHVDGSVEQMDFYNYLLGKMDIRGIRLCEGDIILVPTAGKLVVLDGLVKRPATYELLPEQTLSDMFIYADGLTETNVEVHVTHRGAIANHKEVLSLTKQNQYLPVDGDVIQVVKPADNPDSVVVVSGNVQQPGNYVVGSGIDNLSTLLRLVTPMIRQKKQVVLVYREGELMQIGSQERRLEGRERIIVVDNTISVEGEVMLPMEVDFHADWTAIDYIQAAGGYTKKANKKKVVILFPEGKLGQRDDKLVAGCVIKILRK